MSGRQQRGTSPLSALSPSLAVVWLQNGVSRVRRECQWAGWGRELMLEEQSIDRAECGLGTPLSESAAVSDQFSRAAPDVSDSPPKKV